MSGTTSDAKFTPGAGDQFGTYSITENSETKKLGRAVLNDSSGNEYNSSNPLPVTANSGTNLNTSALALEAGGNLASIKTDTDSLVTNTTGLAKESGGNLATIVTDLGTIDTDLKSNVTLHAGTNIVGKVTTDQTTHGTTDLVAADITKIGGSALSIGTQTAAASIPVALPTATITTLTPPAAITGFATSANQTTELSSLSTIAADVDKIPSQGAAATASSTPVNIASDQVVPTVISTKLMLPLGLYATATFDGQLYTQPPFFTQMADTFDGSTIDTNRWTAGGVTTPTQASGYISLGLNTSNSNSSTLISTATAIPSSGFNIAEGVVQLESTQPTNPLVNRFFGFGQVTSFAYATPVTDGVGFEVDSTGALNCVCWVSGTRYVINSTNNTLISSSCGTGGSGTALPTGGVGSNYGSLLSWPTGGISTFQVFFRENVIYWTFSTFETPCAVLEFVTPAVTTLPLRIASISATSGTVKATTFNMIGAGIADSTAQVSQMGDGTYPWRRAKIDNNGNQNTNEYNTIPNLVNGSATTTGTSDTSVIASAGTGLKNYISGGTVYNSGANSSTITVKNGSGGSTLFTTFAPAGGGSNFILKPPIPTSAATGVYFAAGSSSSTIGISLTGHSAA
jgi:hypothetical protein